MKHIIPTLLIVFASLIFAIGIGSVFISPKDCFAILAYKLGFINLPANIKTSYVSIIWNLRLPRVLFAFFAGASLSVSGAVMQSVLKNPLASSYTLGISSGASLGAALVILTGSTIPLFNVLGVPLASIIFSALTFFLVMAVSKKLDKQRSSGTIILTGIIVSLFISAILTLVSALARQEINRLLLWQMGSFALKGWQPLFWLIPVSIITTIIISLISRTMDVLSFGDEKAISLGLNVKKTQYCLIAFSSILTGVAVAWAGIIGFIDLATPHAVRKITGPSHKLLIPLCFFAGGVFMVFADLIARTLIPLLDLPVGAITAILGAPVLGIIYFNSRKQ